LLGLDIWSYSVYYTLTMLRLSQWLAKYLSHLPLTIKIIPTSVLFTFCQHKENAYYMLTQFDRYFMVWICSKILNVFKAEIQHQDMALICLEMTISVDSKCMWQVALNCWLFGGDKAMTVLYVTCVTVAKDSWLLALSVLFLLHCWCPSL
jgi:hypothetical protein